MTVGSWDRGNGITAGFGNPSLYWTRSWNGADSWGKPPASDPINPVDIGGHSLSDDSVVDPDGFYFGTSPQKPPGKSEPDGYGPYNIVELISARLRHIDRAIDTSARGSDIPTVGLSPTRKPKRARFTENAYSVSEMYRFDAAIFGFGCACPHPTGQTTGCTPYTWNGFAMRDFGVTSWSATNLFNANDQAALVERFRGKMNGSQFNMAVFLAESNEALKMLGESSSRLFHYFNALKRGKLVDAVYELFGDIVDEPRPGTRKPRTRPAPGRDLTDPSRNSFNKWASKWYPRWMDRTRDLQRRVIERKISWADAKHIVNQSRLRPKSIARVHLEIQYGWLPLLKDIEDASQHVARSVNSAGQTTFRASLLKQQVSTRTTAWQYGCPSGTTQVEAGGQKTHRRGITARVKERPSFAKLNGLTAPETVLWEKLPYSFIIDWFIPVGQWLSARSFASGLQGTFITSDKMTGQADGPGGCGANWVYQSQFANPVTYSQVSFTRTISSTLDVPMPVVIPLSEAFSWRHAANMAALILQRLI